MIKISGGICSRQISDYGTVTNKLRGNQMEESAPSCITDSKALPLPADKQDGVVYRSTPHFYRVQLARDVMRCGKGPSVLIEMVSALVSITSAIVAYFAYRRISYLTTGIDYGDFNHLHNTVYHDASSEQSELGVSDVIYIYRLRTYSSWRSLTLVSLVLIAIDLIPPAIAILIILRRAPKKVHTMCMASQLLLLAIILVEDGAVALCKNMLFVGECPIRAAIMSPISRASASLSFVNSLIKTILYVWRLHHNSKKASVDVELVYADSSKEPTSYKWHHCMLPVTAHFIVVTLTIWALVNSSTPSLICPNS